MNKNFTLLTCLVLFAVVSLTAQQRYVDQIFDEVEITSDVVYGQNATLLYLAQAGGPVKENLLMDIYQPVGDTETERPLMLVFHTGNFLPSITNGQISGEKVDSSAVEICTRLAKMGYVAASVDYRKGWNPLADSQPERALGLIQAAYRGVQDGRNAARFFRNDADNGNNYNIDPTKISAFGLGTGGYITLAMASLDKYNEILETSNDPLKFWLDGDGDGTPETPMVVQGFHGDIEGKVETVLTMDGFGLSQGDTTNYSNYPDYNSDISLSINIGGALGDLAWLDENTPPTISVQSPFDIFAPYNDRVLIVPTTGDPIVKVQGGIAIARRQQELGNLDVLNTVEYNDSSTPIAQANSALDGVDHEYIEGLFPFVRPANSFDISEGVVIDWWDPNGPSPVNGQGMGIPYNQLPHPSGVSFHEAGLMLNEGMSAEKARANITEILTYVMPRACVALELGNCTTVGVKETVLDASLLSVNPNPAFESFVVATTNNQMIENITVRDIQGKVVASYNNVNATSQTVDTAAFNSGLYIVQANVENGMIITRVTVK